MNLKGGAILLINDILGKYVSHNDACTTTNLFKFMWLYSAVTVRPDSQVKYTNPAYLIEIHRRVAAPSPGTLS